MIGGRGKEKARKVAAVLAECAESRTPKRRRRMAAEEEDDWDLEARMLSWLKPDETCEDLVSRLARTRVEIRTSLPFLDLGDPAGAKDASKGRTPRTAGERRLRMRAGQVLEICGSNDTCKTECLLQAAATCVLPKVCGGCASKVLFIEMTGGMDPLRLVQILDSRIRKKSDPRKVAGSRLLEESLKRFDLVRCYNNLDLICALKALTPPGDGEDRGEGAIEDPKQDQYLLILIDNINAFYWIERSFDSSSRPAPGRCGGLQPGGPSPLLREVSYSLQNVYEAVALNLKRAARALGSAVIATRNTQLGGPPRHPKPTKVTPDKNPLPKAWRDLVHYKVLVDKSKTHPKAFCARWETPPREGLFPFAVRDDSLEAL